MQKFDNLEDLRRYIAQRVGAVKIGKEISTPYQTVSRYIKQYDPPVSQGTEFLIAQGAYNAATDRIKELESEAEEFKNFLPYIQEWILDLDRQ